MSSVHHWSPLIIKTVEKEEKMETEAEALYFSWQRFIITKVCNAYYVWSSWKKSRTGVEH